MIEITLTIVILAIILIVEFLLILTAVILHRIRKRLDRISELLKKGG